MSAWDQTVVIGRKARPSGGVRQGPTSLERAKAVGAVKENDRKSAYFVNQRMRARTRLLVRITSTLPSWTAKMRYFPLLVFPPVSASSSARAVRLRA